MRIESGAGADHFEVIIVTNSENEEKNVKLLNSEYWAVHSNTICSQ